MSKLDKAEKLIQKVVNKTVIGFNGIPTDDIEKLRKAAERMDFLTRSKPFSCLYGAEYNNYCSASRMYKKYEKILREAIV